MFTTAPQCAQTNCWFQKDRPQSTHNLSTWIIRYMRLPPSMRLMHPIFQALNKSISGRISRCLNKYQRKRTARTMQLHLMNSWALGKLKLSLCNISRLDKYVRLNLSATKQKGLRKNGRSLVWDGAILIILKYSRRWNWPAQIKMYLDHPLRSASKLRYRTTSGPPIWWLDCSGQLPSSKHWREGGGSGTGRSTSNPEQVPDISGWSSPSFLSLPKRKVWDVTIHESDGLRFIERQLQIETLTSTATPSSARTRTFSQKGTLATERVSLAHRTAHRQF